MIKRKWFCLIALLTVTAAAMMPQRTIAQASDTVPRVLAAVNAARLENGLPPYQLNSLLTLAAQRHSEYQASIGSWTHSSADGGRTLQRVLAVGYPATRANENVYSGRVSPEEAAYWWYTADADHRNNVLHPVMREIGIGAALDGDGTIYYTMDISAQPNVLPVFINGGAYSTASASVTLTLTNELIFPSTPGQIGQVSQVMISNFPDFSGASQVGWAQSIPWTLDTASGAGQKTVYVRYIDGAGRTADAQATILLDANGAAAPPPAQPTSVPVVPTSVPPTAVPQQPAKAQPTSAPIQPTSIPTGTPELAATQAEVAMLAPAPTLDFSDSQYMRAQRGEFNIANTAETAQNTDITSNLSLREILWLALMFGIALIAIGILRLRAFQRSDLTLKETASDGDD